MENKKLTEEFYIGQTFDDDYPITAALWCNNRGDCHIELVAEDDILKRYQIIENRKQTQEELEQEIAMLSLTAADVERGIYKAIGMDFDDVIAKVQELKPQGLDIIALKIELKANNFYRGNSYVNAVGRLLGFTKEQLDSFFETNDFMSSATTSRSLSYTSDSVMFSS